MMTNRLKKEAPFAVMLVPLLLVYLLFFIVPLLYTTYFSFTNWNNYTPTIQTVGFSNYLKLFQDKSLIVGIKNSFQYAIVNVLLCNIISLPVAVLLNSKLKGRNIFRAIYFSPAVLSALVVGFLWSYILSSSDYGLANMAIKAFGFKPVNFLGNKDIAMWSIIGTQVWQWFGWSMVVYLANLQSISQDIYEAANIDGSNAWQTFWKITLPMLAPAVKINIVTGMIAGLKVFDIVISLTKGGPGYATQTILTLMFSKFSEGNYGYASAFGILFLLISVAFAAVLLNLFKIWERKLS